jgi:ABC-type amino acid transport substrate-binding protein
MSYPRNIATAILALAVGLSGVTFAATVTVMGDDAYPPVAYLENGTPKGILVDILKKVEKITQDTYEVKLFPWKRSYELAARGEGGILGLSYTEERSKNFDYSRPLYEDNIQIVVLSGHAFSYSTLADLKGKKIGGVNGASYGQEVDEAIAKGLFSVDRDVSQIGRLKKLLVGRLDAAFIGNGQVGFDKLLNSAPELKNARNKFEILPVPLTKDQLHIAFAKSMNQKDVVERFDKAIDKLKKSGELKKVLSDAAK